MASYSLDVEQFISEVEKHPEIWDNNCEDYRNKNRKGRAWTNIGESLFPENYHELNKTERNDLQKKLLSKWRNIRDSYVRHLKRSRGKGNYLHAKQLSFLYDICKQAASDDGEDQENTTEDTWPSDSEEIKFKKLLLKKEYKEPIWDEEQVESRRKRKKTDIEFVETSFPEASNSFSVFDEDRSFFDSLLPAVRDFPIDLKLEFRSDVIKLIKQYRSTAFSKVNLD